MTARLAAVLVLAATASARAAMPPRTGGPGATPPVAEAPPASASEAAPILEPNEAAAPNEVAAPIEPEAPNETEVPIEAEVPIETGDETIEIVTELPPGAAHTVSTVELERFERDDVHKILASVPGVYVRQEDGFGLRPNIGMRGAAAERSAKVTLMEDGILLAPAPYAAPAAYYFPIVTRMIGLEVVKGPGAIVYGPATVGGALNLTTREVPEGRAAAVDLAGGSYGYGKLHAWAAEGGPRLGVLAEAVRLQSDGFKRIDGGGDAGFTKHEVMVKSRARLGTTHELELKLAYSGEVSHETYTGLADVDFAASPYRRYRATALDRFDGQRGSFALRDRAIVAGGHAIITTTAYASRFSRDWRKLNGFRDPAALADVLADPTAGTNAVLYGVLTGESDSTGGDELLIGTNARDFTSYGAQIVAAYADAWGRATHGLEAGLRLHADDVDRLHTEDAYLVVGGELVRGGMPTATTRDTHDTARALAIYGRDEVTIGRVRATAGLRAELVKTAAVDHAAAGAEVTGSYAALIPGAGVVVSVARGVEVLAGVHRGFVPVAPGQQGQASPETSVNVEAGTRARRDAASAELLGFYSDYANIKGTCTQSSGCAEGQLDDEFDGGHVRIVGLEAAAAHEPRWRKLRFPLGVTYTLTRSSFRSAFTSDNPEWGTIEIGDELPYTPRHVLALQAGIGGARWEVVVSPRYTSPMRDVAGQGAFEPGRSTGAAFVLDAVASLGFGRWGKAYLTIDNATDEAVVVARRPFGARPGVPRLVIVGYKNAF